MSDSITDKVKREGVKMGMKAVSKILQSPERADRVMKAVGAVQKSREAMDDATGKMRNLGQMPSRDDVRALSRQAGRLRREAKKILAVLDDIEERLEE